MHHRVKNNLQTVAMLLRLQIGHPNLSPQNILNETINRVLSIATVHEILSEAGTDKVGILDLLKRLVATISTNMINPTAEINISVSGDNVELDSKKATNLALIANELLQNALEHGIAGHETGNISLTLTNYTNGLKLTVVDDGQGLPTNFDIETGLGLGLEIVHSSVTEDMQGRFSINRASHAGGTEVIIDIPG
jgi:two-component sensor histidine kinase